MKYVLLVILFMSSFATTAQDSLSLEYLLLHDTATGYISGFDPASVVINNEKLNSIEKPAVTEYLYPWAQANEWQFYILFVLVLFIGIIRFSYYKDIQELFAGFFNYNLANQIYRDHEASAPFSFFLLNVNFFAVTSLFILFASEYYGLLPRFNTLHSWIIISAALLAVIFVKSAVNFIIARIFSFGREIYLFNFHSGLLLKIGGITLLPLLIILSFVSPPLIEYVIIFTGILALAFIFFRYIRGLAIAGEYLRFHKFHFFLYICTLEIAPIILIIKILRSGLF